MRSAISNDNDDVFQIRLRNDFGKGFASAYDAARTMPVFAAFVAPMSGAIEFFFGFSCAALGS
jgi:hypothetical protein